MEKEKNRTKGRLQDATPFKVMSFQEAAKAMGWHIDADSDSFQCTCDCGNSKIEYSGFFGIEIAECESCGKKIINMFAPMQTGSTSAQILDFSKFEVEKDKNGYDRFWIADDGKGGVKNE